MWELCRRNINPSSFDGEGDSRGSPRVLQHSLKLRSFELPLASTADRTCMYVHVVTLSLTLEGEMLGLGFTYSCIYLKVTIINTDYF